MIFIFFLPKRIFKMRKRCAARSYVPIVVVVVAHIPSMWPFQSVFIIFFSETLFIFSVYLYLCLVCLFGLLVGIATSMMTTWFAAASAFPAAAQNTISDCS